MERPYTPEERKALCDAVCHYMENEGLSMRKSCIKAGVSIATYMTWKKEDVAALAQYTKAHKALVERMADDILEISDNPPERGPDGKVDNGEVQNRRLRIESRKWLLSKIAREDYGDKVQISGDKENPLEVKASLDVSNLSTDVLAAIMAAKDRASKAPENASDES